MSALVSDTAMVMAAGLGKRMRPLTATMPKPLVRVAGKPLIDHTLDRLADAGLARAVVNVHYLADALEAHLAERKAPKVDVSDERDALLETGGGMIKAQGQLPDPFFCLNSDNIWLDGPRNAFAELSERWDAAGGVTRRKSGRIAPFIYTGIQLVSHHLLRDAPSGKFSTNILWDRAIEEGRLFGLPFTGDWFEVGTPDAVRLTEDALASG